MLRAGARWDGHPPSGNGCLLQDAAETTVLSWVRQRTAAAGNSRAPAAGRRRGITGGSRKMSSQIAVAAGDTSDIGDFRTLADGAWDHLATWVTTAISSSSKPWPCGAIANQVSTEATARREARWSRSWRSKQRHC